MEVVHFAEHDEVGSIALLYHDVWHETHGPYMPKAECEVRDFLFFVERITGLMPNVLISKDNEITTGFASWSGCLLGQVFVVPAYRGRQAAIKLLQRAEIELHQQGIELAELHCLVGNNRAKRFYKRAGWVTKEIISEALNGKEGDNSREFWSMYKQLC